MANSREIVKRLKSVGNIRKITGTMEMIATAKFKKAFDRAVGSRPYSEKIAQMVSTLAACGTESQHPILQVNDQSNTTLLLMLSANRGLCGGYNGNVIRQSVKKINAIKEKGENLYLLVSGKKGMQYCKFAKFTVEKSYDQFDDYATYEQVEALANEIISLYTRKKIDRVKVVYTRFASTSRYFVETMNLLPLTNLTPVTEDETAATTNDDYIFSPSAGDILDELVPATVRVSLYQCFMDAIVSEQVSRMSAMKAATDNAKDIISSLGRQYNRARQTQITNELLDIMGGVEAMK
jgi:F-type H+-transporting ATPase subunit gamma